MFDATSGAAVLALLVALALVLIACAVVALAVRGARRRRAEWRLLRHGMSRRRMAAERRERARSLLAERVGRLQARIDQAGSTQGIHRTLEATALAILGAQVGALQTRTRAHYVPFSSAFQQGSGALGYVATGVGISQAAAIAGIDGSLSAASVVSAVFNRGGTITGALAWCDTSAFGASPRAPFTATLYLSTPVGSDSAFAPTSLSLMFPSEGVPTNTLQVATSAAVVSVARGQRYALIIVNPPDETIFTALNGGFSFVY